MGGIGTCPISVHPNAASGLISIWIKLGRPQKLGVSAPKNEHPVAGKIQWKKQIIHDNISPNHLFIVAWSKKVPNWMDLLESDQLAGLNYLNIGPWAMWISAVWWRRVVIATQPGQGGTPITVALGCLWILCTRSSAKHSSIWRNFVDWVSTYRSIRKQVHNYQPKFWCERQGIPGFDPPPFT